MQLHSTLSNHRQRTLPGVHQMSNSIGVMQRSSKQEPHDADCILSEGRHAELVTEIVCGLCKYTHEQQLCVRLAKTFALH